MPFDPTIKRTEGTLKGADGRTFKCTKGAPHIILKLVEVDQEEVAKRVNWKVRRMVYQCLFISECIARWLISAVMGA
jgi:magnesium-transporting ATPase (P-type)